LFDVFYDKKIHVAVLIGVPIGIGAEENHLLGVELFDENPQIRQEPVGNPVDRIARIPEDVFPDGGCFQD